MSLNTNSSIRSEAAKVKEKIKARAPKAEPKVKDETPKDSFVAEAAPKKTSSKSKAEKKPEGMKINYLPQDPGMLPVQEVTTNLKPDLTSDRFKISESPTFKQPKVDEQGNMLYSPEDPRFDGPNAYFIANQTLEMAEKYAGRSIPWGFSNELSRDQLIIHPHLLKDEANAFYSSETGSVNLSHYVNREGATERTASQADVVAHETGHAILDGMRPTWLHSMSVASGGFHESFGDMMSILRALNEDSVLAELKQETGGQLLIPNIVSSVGEQIGNTIYGAKSKGSLRQAINDTKYSDAAFLPFMDRTGEYAGLGTECHAYSKLFTAAFYDMFNGIYEEANSSPDVSFKEAVVQARDTAGKLLFKAIDLSPVGDVSYKEMALAFMKADIIENDGANMSAIGTAFVGRKILTEEDLAGFAAAETTKEIPNLRFSEKLTSAEGAEKFLDKNREKLGLPDSAKFEFQSVRTTDEGQKLVTFTTHRDQLMEGKEWGLYEGAKLRAHGGLQLVFGAKGVLEDTQYDPVTDDELEDSSLNFRRNLGIGGIVDGSLPSGAPKDGEEKLPRLHIQTLSEGNSRVIQRAPVVYCTHGEGCNCGGA